MRALVIATLLSLSLASAAAGATTAQGRWITSSGNLEVEIAPCGPALCGTVKRVLANNSMQAINQPSTAAPPRIGSAVLTALRPDGAGRWKGKLYNRENGRTYDCNVRLMADGALEVRAYVVLPLFGQTQVWRRP